MLKGIKKSIKHLNHSSRYVITFETAFPGVMAEWSKALAWKASKRFRFVGSNPTNSAAESKLQ